MRTLFALTSLMITVAFAAFTREATEPDVCPSDDSVF